MSSDMGPHCQFIENNPLSKLFPVLFGTFHGTTLASNSIELKQVLPLKALPGNMDDQLRLIILLYLESSLGSPPYIWGSFQSRGFHSYLKCPPFPATWSCTVSLHHILSSLSPPILSMLIKSILFHTSRVTHVPPNTLILSPLYLNSLGPQTETWVSFT